MTGAGLALLLAAAGSALPAFADGTLEPGSSITVTFWQLAIPVDAAFKHFTANIDFDPAKPAEGSAQFSVDVASLDTGSQEYNDEALGSDWFDASHFPTASFSSSRLVPFAENQLVAVGKLTIKGRTQDAVLAITYTTVGELRTFDGVIHVSRTAYNVGTGEWLSSAIVSDDVAITVHATTRARGMNRGAPS